MNTQNTTIAPVWRLLEPGEIIKEGDEYFDVADRVFVTCYRYIHGHPASHKIVHRRRLEPDPVKAELLATLEELSESISDMTGMTEEPPSPFLSRAGLRAFMANKSARERIARAKFTA